MTNFEILTLIIGTGTLGIILKIAFATGKIITKVEMIDQSLNELKRDVRSLDSRVSRIEGQMNPFYHWEPKIKTKEE